MRQILRAGMVLGMALLLAGCIQTKDEYTINPDGSGKVVHEAVMQGAMNLNVSDPSDGSQNPAAQLTNAVQDELEKATGVDAWKDVSFARTADGRIQFKATAYFPKLSGFSLYNGGFHSDFLEPAIKLDDQGGMVLDLSQKEKKKAHPETNLVDAAASEDAKIQAEKAKYQQMKPMMAAMLGTMLIEEKFHLPGEMVQTSNLKHEAPNTYTVTMDGKKLLAMMDSLVADDSWWREQIRSGKNLEKDNPLGGDLFNEKMFGERGPIRATVQAPLQPQFNYAAEVAAAKVEHAKYLKTSGLNAGAAGAVTIPQAAAGAPFKTLTVGGVRIIRVADQKRGIQPFNDTAGYALSLIGELPGTVLEVNEGKLEIATADNGEDLLPEHEWDQKIHFLRLSTDKSAVTFEIKMTMPGPDVKGFKELSGSIEYTVASGTRQVDVGITDYKAGTTGKELGATIMSIKDNSFNKGHQSIVLKLAVPHAMVKSVTFYDTDGTVLKAMSAGSGWSGNNSTTLTYSLPDQFPPTGRIVVEINDNMEKRTIPFKLTNLSLLGLPL